MRRLTLAVALLMLAQGALAQGVAGSVELTPTVGYWFGDVLTRGTTGAFNFDVTIDDAPSYGLRLGYHFTPNWALEAFIAKEDADLLTGHDELFGGREKVGSIDLTTATVGFEGSMGNRRLVPFLAGGIGAMHLNPSTAAMASDTRFTANFGGGFKLFFSPEMALRFDFRGHAVNIGDRRNDCDWWESCLSNDEWITFREVALGLTFVF
jgi:outer membrane beta-barrel protein